MDYGALFGLTEIFHVWYVIAVAVGAASGAITNFVLNRHWSFAASDKDWKKQAFRYGIVSLGSLILNTAGTFAVTEWGGLHYSWSVGLVSVLVGVAYNYPMQKNWVFPHR